MQTRSNNTNHTANSNRPFKKDPPPLTPRELFSPFVSFSQPQQAAAAAAAAAAVPNQHCQEQQQQQANQSRGKNGNNLMLYISPFHRLRRRLFVFSDYYISKDVLIPIRTDLPTNSGSTTTTSSIKASPFSASFFSSISTRFPPTLSCRILTRFPLFAFIDDFLGKRQQGTIRISTNIKTSCCCYY
jgi:hypothetical protein